MPEKATFEASPAVTTTVPETAPLEPDAPSSLLTESTTGTEAGVAESSATVAEVGSKATERDSGTVVPTSVASTDRLSKRALPLALVAPCRVSRTRTSAWSSTASTDERSTERDSNPPGKLTLPAANGVNVAPPSTLYETSAVWNPVPVFRTANVRTGSCSPLVEKLAWRYRPLFSLLAPPRGTNADPAAAPLRALMVDPPKSLTSVNVCVRVPDPLVALTGEGKATGAAGVAGGVEVVVGHQRLRHGRRRQEEPHQEAE